MNIVQELIAHIVKSIVSDSNSVSIIMHEHEDKDQVEIIVSAQDRGRVIGKEGKTIKAIRNVVEASFGRDKKIFIDLTQDPS